jgi:chemotaxis protein CheD
MHTTLSATGAREIVVNMGHIALGRGDDRLKAVLGSCVGLAVYHPRLKVGALAHVVLAESAGRDGAPGKYADTAVPHLLKLLAEWNVPAHGLTAKIAGGANMFGTSGPLQIGDANVHAVTRALRAAGIRIAGKHVGGPSGRRIVYECASGRMIVQQAGKPEQAI